MEIDERVNAVLSRPLEGARPCLWLDATCMKLREGGRIVSRAAMIAVAVNEDGRREVLGVAAGFSDAFAELTRPHRGHGPRSPFRTDFLRSLADRGLRGVKLVVADDHKGLRAAARRVFNVTHQRCRVHWMIPPCESADSGAGFPCAAIRDSVGRNGQTEATWAERWRSGAT